MATQVALGWKLSPEGTSPGCPQQCEWVRCLELRGRASMSCLCAEPYQMPLVPGVSRHRVLSAEVGV